MSDLDVLIQIGLEGESLQLHSLSGSSSVEWELAVAWKQPLTWYKVRRQQSFRTIFLFFFLRERQVLHKLENYISWVWI